MSTANRDGQLPRFQRARIMARGQPTAAKPPDSRGWQAVTALSSVGMLLLTGVIYVYTVKPAYDKNEAQRETAALQEQATNIRAELNFQRVASAQEREQILKERDELRSAQVAEMRTLRQQREELAAEVEASRTKLPGLQAELKFQYAQVRRIRGLSQYAQNASSSCRELFSQRAARVDTLRDCLTAALEYSSMPEDDKALAAAWIPRIAPQQGYWLSMDEGSMILLGWNALKHEFPIARACLRLDYPEEPSKPAASDPELAAQCEALRPRARIFGEAYKQRVGIETSVARLVEAVEQRADVKEYDVSQSGSRPMPPTVVLVE